MAVHLASGQRSCCLPDVLLLLLLCLQVILLKDVESLGSTGQLMNVPIGYWRNFLQPQGIAKVASERILE
jgi:hypothetical protein